MASTAFCLGPHECALLVNRRSRDSVELANYYAHLRQIPPINIIRLDLPDKALDANASFTPEEFHQYIYEPVKKALKERKISSHVLTWLYSVGFPSTINTKPRMSLTGMTYVRGRVPDAKAIQSGKWRSPMFVGPDSATGPFSASTSMEEFTLRLTTNMPIPSMMISWTGSRGLTVEQAKDQLKRSAASDGAHPSASVYFETSEDIRSKLRSWQFESATKELAGLGIAAFTSSNPPPNRPDIMGILGGRRTVYKKTKLQPGGYADHLTSFAAVFNDPAHSKLTEWLELGASGSSGTITEPGSKTEPVPLLWAKFPHARLFAHYANGCTLIESLFLSIRSPLQILLVGDALCSPWAKPPGITLVNMADDEDSPIEGKSEYLASSWGGFGQQAPTIIFFVDGRPVSTSGKSNLFSIDTARLYDGYHHLRVVAYAYGTVRHQGFDQTFMQTRNHARSSTITGYKSGQKADLYHELAFQVSAKGTPREIALIAQERIIARAPFTNNMTIGVHPLTVGAGPVTFQAVAVYDKGGPARSEPVTLHLEPLNSAPEITSINIITNNKEALVINMSTRDEDHDTPIISWYVDALKLDSVLEFSPDTNVENNSPGTGKLRVALQKGNSCATIEADTPTRIKELRTIIRFTEGTRITGEHNAGIVFNYLDPENFMYWGINGKRSAWVLSRFENGNGTTILSRGARINTHKDYDVMILSLGNGKMGFFVNDNLMATADASFSAGRIGVRNGPRKTEYNHLFVGPPSAFRSFYREQTEDLIVDTEYQNSLKSVYGVARDVQFTPFKPVQ